MKLIFFAMTFLTLSSAFGYDCYSDCGAEARTTYPCPTFRNPHRRCDGRNPIIFAACETAQAAACRVLQPVEGAVIGKLAVAIADNPGIQDEAKGWTTATCAVSGAAAISAVGAGYSVPICAALNVAAVGCATFVASSGALIIGATCNQLCTDHQLKDCRN